MKNFHTLLLLLAFYITGHTQQAVLVSDFNPGEESGFDNWNHTAHHINDVILIPLNNPDHGLELGVIKGGVLSLLKDLIPGEESSNPTEFITFKGLVYFSAKTADGKNALWVTDGTTEGTKIAFDPGFEASFMIRFIKSKSDHLYMVYSGEIYKTDGVTFENLGEGFFSCFDITTTKSVVQYKDEIALIEEGSRSVSITEILPDGSYNLLVEMNLDASTDVDAFISLGDYLLFDLDVLFNDDQTGFYSWKEGEAEPTKLDLPSVVRRFLKLNDNTMVASVFATGFYSFVANDDLIYELQYDGFPEPFVQGESMPGSVKQEKALYLGTNSFPNRMLITDANTLETTTSFEVQANNSNMICHNNYAFIAGGTSNGFEPAIQAYNFKTDTHTEVIKFEESSNNTKSIILTGVQDEKLYFLSNLDPDVGRELYTVDVSDLLDLNLSADELTAAHDLVIYNNGFELKDDNFSEYNYALYNSNGQLLDSKTCNTNTFYSFGSQSGILILNLEIEGQEYSRKVFLGN